MNTTQNTHRIIATALLAVTAGLVLSSCAERTVPEPVVHPTNAQAAEMRAGLDDLAESRARMARDLAKQRAAVAAEQMAGQRDFAGARARAARELAEQRSAGYPDLAEGCLRIGH
ncbi:hypothetical protein [Agromyces laixinhei]|uniref:hypothetical protein n=1 Tax=Agromyces laixinhei TaxID=2585717 RepID=UPI0012EDF224|nr:hypothetical protein [Agromyces laixinhei]